MATLPLRLDRNQSQPLPVQLSGAIRTLVIEGALAKGSRLPSIRALALDLGVARSVVEQAYDQLLAEAWLEARRGSGTYVASGKGMPGYERPPRTRPTELRLVRLDAGTPWIDPRHLSGWRRAWREVSAATPPRGYEDPRGIPELRAALAERLARTRGLILDPDELLITSGTTDGLRHLLPSLSPGPVALEDPGYRAAVETVRAGGRGVVDLPATEPVTSLHGCAAAYVTPAHQHPLSRVMPASDRLSLLRAAHEADAIVLEDDYDSEFRYDVAPVPAMAALDRTRVAYLGSAAKSVAPSLRIGWLAPTPDLLDDVNRRRTVTHDAPSWPAQRALLTLLRDGWLDKVVRTARRVYSERAPRVAAALGSFAEPAGPQAGMYSTWLLPEPDAVRARDAARAAGFDINLLSGYCRAAGLTGLVIGFGGVSDEELDRALGAIVAGLRSQRRS